MLIRSHAILFFLNDEKKLPVIVLDSRQVKLNQKLMNHINILTTLLLLQVLITKDKQVTIILI
jgi:hypothetical protein